MPDRKRVVYKTPLFRIVETGIILTLTILAALAWRERFPGISSSYVIVGSLAFGFLLIPQFGAAVAARLGAPLVTRDERTRRYLREITPIGYGRPTAIPAMSHARRNGSRSLRRR